MLEQILSALMCILTILEILNAFLHNLVEDKSYKELLLATNKFKYLWSKKSRMTLLFTDFMETPEYAKIKAKFDRLYYPDDRNRSQRD